MKVDIRPRLRSFRVPLLLALAAIVFSLLCISCQQVTDPAGSISLTGSTSVTLDKCIDKCNRVAQKQVTQQTRVHNLLLSLCHDDPGCILAENPRFALVLAEIEAERLACIDECHHQGGATGGQ